MSRLVSVDPKGMKLIEHHLRRDGAEGLIGEEVDEGRLVGLGQSEVFIDVLSEVLAKETQLHERTCRIRMRVGLGEPAQGRKFGPKRPKHFEILGFHRAASARAASKASLFFTMTGASRGSSNRPATSNRSRLLK